MTDFAPFHYEPARGGPKEPSELELSGLERVELDARGEGLPPPIAHLTGMRPTEAKAGRMVFVIPATDWLRSSDGMIGSTAATFLGDAPIGGACLSVLGPWTVIPTIELSFVYVGAVSDAESLVGVGSLVSADDGSAVATVAVSSDSGRTLAIGSTRVMVTKVTRDQLRPAAPTVEPTDLPDPWLRPVTGRALTNDETADRSGREVVEEMAAGRLPSPPIAHLLGLRLVAAGQGKATVEMVASGWHLSPGGTMYGGSLAAGAEHALSLAALTMAEPGYGAESLDLKVNYVRPVFGDGTVLSFQATLEHAGRRVVVGSVRGLRPDGMPVVLASGTVLLTRPHD